MNLKFSVFPWFGKYSLKLGEKSFGLFANEAEILAYIRENWPGVEFELEEK